MKKILFYSNQGLSPLHLGIEMEILQKLIDEGNEILIVTCSTKTSGCFFNPTFNPIACAICQARTFKLHQLLIHTNNIKIVDLYSSIPIQLKIDNFNEEKILNLDYKGIKIGRGVISSVISLKREYSIFTENYKKLILQQIEIAIRCIDGILPYIEKFNPIQLYFFNGRFSETYPLIDIAKKYKLQYVTFEVGSNTAKYSIFENGVTHGIKIRFDQMMKLWGQGEAYKIEVAEKWFKSKVEGTNIDDKSYILNQEKNLLPIDFDVKKMNVAIFNSSEDEMKTIEEWQHNLYKTQNEGILNILSLFKNDNDIHFYLRIHPNLGNIVNTQTKEVSQMNQHNFTIIDGNDPIDSYFLMQSCDKIISFGSTIGIEATYHNKVSILYGTSFYQGLDAVYEPQNNEELKYLILSKTIQPKAKIKTYPYAYFLTSRGIDYRYFEYKGKYDSSYKGLLIKRFYLLTYVYLLINIVNIIKWIKKFKTLYNKYPSIMDLKILKK